MANPFFSNKTSPNGATAPNDSLNESHKRYFRGYNRFNLTRQFYNTERYADINLIEVMEGVEGDTLPFGNRHDIRTFTLKSPIMFDVYKKKTYFAVNNQAILPNNWKKVYKQPNKGDDVDVSVNCVSQLISKYAGFFNNLKVGAGRSDLISNFSGVNLATYILRMVLLMENIFSNGSLLASMNCHLSNMISVNSGNSFDGWLDRFYRFVYEQNYCFTIPSLGSKSFGGYGSTANIKLSVSEFTDLLRTFPDFKLLSDDFFPTGTLDAEDLLPYLDQLSFNYNTDLLADKLNLSRLIAYQLVCAQFYTRDSVDNIYTAEDFIDNCKSIIVDVASAVDTGITTSPRRWPTFSYNGTLYDYDVFSGKIIDSAFEVLCNRVFTNSVFVDYVDDAYFYLHSIFFYRKSLRFGDYFIGAKTIPFSPLGDLTTAEVIGNGVSALEITRSIIAQRFANLVERVTNTWEGYLKGVTDGIASPDPKLPRFLASSTSKVGGFEVENTTSEDQGNIVTILKSGNSNYVYKVTVGEPCIIIGVSTYEVPRVYSATVSRFFRHSDRFEMFNKNFQNIGDQEITQNERNAAFSPALNFGYTPRHMEYKQRYPIAAGGFVENLEGFAFITDNKQSRQNDIDLGDTSVIGSYYLRNRNSEFDRFYSSLTGCTLASYFHFICKYDLICNARRQMEYSPSIL